MSTNVLRPLQSATAPTSPRKLDVPTDNAEEDDQSELEGVAGRVSVATTSPSTTNDVPAEENVAATCTQTLSRGNAVDVAWEVIPRFARSCINAVKEPDSASISNEMEDVPCTSANRSTEPPVDAGSAAADATEVWS